MLVEQILATVVVGLMFGIPGGIALILYNHFTGKYDKLIEKEWKKKWEVIERKKNE